MRLSLVSEGESGFGCCCRDRPEQDGAGLMQLRYYSKDSGKLAEGVRQGGAGAGAGLCFKMMCGIEIYRGQEWEPGDQLEAK